MKRGSGIKDRDDRSSGIEILIAEAFELVVECNWVWSSHSQTSRLSSHRQSYIGLVFSSRFIDLIINYFISLICSPHFLDL
jgi:hypothetical protein